MWEDMTGKDEILLNFVNLNKDDNKQNIAITDNTF